MVMLEIPEDMDVKFVRIIALLSGIIYNFWWFYFLAYWFYVIFYYEMEAASLFLAMILSYNLVVTSFAVPINFVIAAKELSLEWIQLNKVSTEEDLSLGVHNFVDLFMDVVDVFRFGCYVKPALCWKYE